MGCKQRHYVPTIMATGYAGVYPMGYPQVVYHATNRFFITTAVSTLTLPAIPFTFAAKVSRLPRDVRPADAMYGVHRYERSSGGFRQNIPLQRTVQMSTLYSQGPRAREGHRDHSERLAKVGVPGST
ncbi:hypothetical protein J6590_067334 [Homalodisca vitripennis]|nr:hypothetical protein J6590_067334 [Homalodisca vitripennis]